MIDESIIAYCIKYQAINELQSAAVSPEDFIDEYRTVWKYILRMKRDHDAVPSADTLQARFPDLDLPRVRKNELPMLLHNLKQRKKFIDFMGVLNDAAGSGVNYENVEEVIQSVQGRLNSLAFRGTTNHVVDLFGDPDIAAGILHEMRQRRRGMVRGIPTGLQRFDNLTGGLHKQKMCVVIGRTGIGKSWLDLYMVASAILDGKTCILYPLEMNLFETALRLYTIFSQQMFLGQKTLKNHDLTTGNVNMKRVVKFLHLLEDKFSGTLRVADIGSIQDQYTTERIESEVEIYRPDMFWVDYITLLKPPVGGRNDSEHGQIRKLSNGIAGIAKRRDCVGGCSAQVNREAIRAGGNKMLPRLEHIAYGDSIGQDADVVFSLNRKEQYLYYALVKNRGGVEFGKTRALFDPNHGRIDDSVEQEPEPA